MGTPLTVKDLAWAAGFIEGEGSFYHNGNSATVRAAQVQREPLERLQRMFGGSIVLSDNGLRKDGTAKNKIHQWYIHGKRAAGVMMTLYVMLSPRRQWQANAALAFWKNRPVASRDRQLCMRGHKYAFRATTGRGRGFGRYCPTCQIERASARRVQQEQRA